MKSKTELRFWKAYNELPPTIQKLAKQKFRLWQKHPFHPSLHFKELRPRLWSVRINPQYRAIARQQKDLIVWFWIGTHDHYDAKI